MCALMLAWCSLGAQTIEKVSHGIWKVTYGTPEQFLPTDFKEAPSEEALRRLSDNPAPPFPLENIRFKQMAQGTVAEFTIGESEKLYGFGLQVNSFQQRGMRRDIRCNSWIVGNVGFSHAPMPFFISSAGYGVLVNTARYTTFYAGSQQKIKQSVDLKQTLEDVRNTPGTSPAQLYNRAYKPSNEVEIIVDGAQGMEIYVLEGPTVLEVMRRYNLFSGGGAIPPVWGLGLKYRAKTSFNYQEVLKFVRYFRENNIPCDMFGLEPGWHSTAYSCSYTWNPVNFPNPDSILHIMHGMNYKMNLWEHAYVHPTAPFFESIVPYSGDYAVWKGAVPDFITPEARKIFGDYHEKHFIDKGISAFKLDECDAAYYHEAQAEWSFPDIARFPSGIDGIQYRQLFGLLYQKTIWDLYRRNNKRTLLEVRASHLFAAPYGSVIYSDMYNHTDYVRMILNSGFCGLNWSPEVRETRSDEDLIRRLQSTLMSPHMIVDCWFLNNPPWFHYDRAKNNNNEYLPNYKDLEQKARKLIELRMSLIPYLYAAFSRYHFEGIPPFRSLIMDFPQESEVWKIEDEYMMGDHLLCAPFIDGASSRKVYLPAGIWHDFNTGTKYEGGKYHEITMNLDQIPIFVKDGTILPLAKPVQFITPETVFEITCHVYGIPAGSVQLFEDNGFTFDFEKEVYNRVSLSWVKGKGKVSREGSYKGKLYNVVQWIKK